MADDFELFNAHQEDLRKRVDFLAKSVFLLSGGSLTISVGLFTGSTHPEISPLLAQVLQFSWISFYASIIFALLGLLVMVWRDYFFAEKWRKRLYDPNAEFPMHALWKEVLLWLIGLTSLVCLLVGLSLQAYAACHLISV